MIVSNSVIDLFVALFLSNILGRCQASKKLVVFAGPHQVGANRIHKFFDRFATDYADSSTSKSLSVWKWPTVRSEDDFDLILGLGSDEGEGPPTSRHELFNLLFTRKEDSAIQEALMRAIRDSWEESINGIILGAENFDKVGSDPETGYDSLKTIYYLKEDLDLKNKDVTVVLLYRSPRLDQWVSVWQENTSSEEEFYVDFVCKGYEDMFLYEMLDTAMNPIKLASIYRQHGFNVVLIDEEGVNRSDGDVAHAFACYVLDGVECDDGWISDLKDGSGETEDPDTNKKLFLEDSDAQNLEEIFRQRDCAYKPDIESDASGYFEVVLQRALWRDCKVVRDSEIGKGLLDTEFVLDIVKSQQGCGSQSVEISDILWQEPSTQSANNEANNQVLLMVFIPVTVLIVAFSLAILLLRRARRRRLATQGDSDGLVKGSTGGKGIFANQSSEDGSTESASDDESPQKQLSASGFLDVPLEGSTISEPSSPRIAFFGQSKLNGRLCRACCMVGVDPHCTFCRGGRLPTSDAAGDTATSCARRFQGAVVDSVNDDESVGCFSKDGGADGVGGELQARKSRASSLNGPDSPSGGGRVAFPPPRGSGTPVGAEMDDLNDRWHSLSQQAVKEDGSDAVAWDSYRGRNGRPMASPRVDKERDVVSKSRVVRKLKQLLDLKNEKDKQVDTTRRWPMGRNLAISDTDERHHVNDLL